MNADTILAVRRCLLLIGFILYRLVTLCVGGDGINQKAVALFVANLFHAMAEKAFITPADPISFFMMVMIFGTLYGNNEIFFQNTRRKMETMLLL